MGRIGQIGLVVVGVVICGAVVGCGGTATQTARRGPVINTYVNGRPAKGSPAAARMMGGRREERRGPR